MSTIEELENRVKTLEDELYYLKLIADNNAVNHKLAFLKKDYRFNLLKPRLLNEKLLWLDKNYYNYSPERYYRCDKYYFKYWWRQIFGKEYEIPLLGVWDRAEDIDFDILPQQFVLKRSLSGGSFEIKIVDKQKDDLDDVRRLAAMWLKDDNRPKARIIAEKKLTFEDGYIIDYKFYVMNGKVAFIFCAVMHEAVIGYRTFSFYDLNWNAYNIKYHHNNTRPVPKPDKFNEMIELAEKVGQYFPFMRVDLYFSQGKIYVGELTDMPYNGRSPFGVEWDRKFGEMLKLPSKSELEKNIKQFETNFPELFKNPIFLKYFNETCFIMQQNTVLNTLPPPPKNFIQPMKISLHKVLQIKNKINNIKTNSKFTLGAVDFLEKIDYDLEHNGKFEKWIAEIKSKNLKVSILKSKDMAGQILSQALDFYEVEIVFKTPEASFENLSETDIEQCCKADVIVCANVHSNKKMSVDNKEVINIKEILLQKGDKSR